MTNIDESNIEFSITGFKECIEKLQSAIDKLDKLNLEIMIEKSILIV